MNETIVLLHALNSSNMKKLFPFLIMVFPLILPFLASAQWSTDPGVNNPINITAGEQAIPKIATCPNGDTYIGFFSMESGNYNVRLQRLDAIGNPLWTTGGILISSHPQMTWLTDWDMAADDDNHCILAFQDIRNSGYNDVQVYRISPAGAFVWGADGIQLSNGEAFDASPKVCVTAAGNAVFAWQADDVTIIQKVSPAGALQWGQNGITLSGTERYTWPQLMPVGSDDVILKYFLDTGPSYSPTRHVYAQRYNSSGAAVWSQATAISTAGGISAWTQIFPMVNDGSDGFYIAWHDDRDNNMLSSTFVQHISNTGSVLFQSNGVEASTLGGRNHFYPQLALPPGSSEVYCFWNEMDADQNNRGLYGQKFSSSGARLWATTGMVFIEISSTNVYPLAARPSPTDVVLFYEEYTDAVNGHLKAMRINSSGGYVWTPSVKTICSVTSEKVHTVTNDFADNQWILSWEDTRNSDRDIYAQNIQLDGSLGPVQMGTIEGTVTLDGGSGNVTQVQVSAGDATTSPDAAGFYSMTVMAGTYNVTGALQGYAPDTVFGVVVTTNNTTSGVDLTLEALPTGFITGNVALNGGTGDVTEAVVTAGYHSVNPDNNGDYTMEIEVGTYDVTASLEGYFPETSPGIVVLEGMTTGNVSFTLEPLPTTGFIEGNVELQNGAGDVTQVVINAGDVTVNPDPTGYYILEVTAGIWDVSASLIGFYTQVIEDVTVVAGETTSDIDFFLLQVPESGYIEGTVSLVNGAGDVTDALVWSGIQSAHPSSSGHYFLTVTAGVHTVHASHPYTLSDSISGIMVTAGQTVSNVDFELEIVRGDLVCRAVDTYSNILNGVDVIITGPDTTLNGTITDDSLVFNCVSYGAYSGSASMPDEDPVFSSTILDPDNHEIIFVFDLTGITEPVSGSNRLKTYPNPFVDGVNVRFRPSGQSHCQVNVYTTGGKLVRKLAGGEVQSGWQELYWDGKSDSGTEVPSGSYLIVFIDGEGSQGTILLKK